MIDKSTYLALKKELDCARLIAVSKTQSIESIQALYDMGQRDFGENRVQELLEKKDKLPSDINWHLIGHLQTNKVSEIVGVVDTIHSVDSVRLLNKLQNTYGPQNRFVDVLLQVHIAEEKSKYGFEEEEIFNLIKNNKFYECYPHLNVVGLMGMATYTKDESIIQKEFLQLENLFIEIDELNILNNFTELCIGMSSDYQIALDCGATMVRIGSRLFN
jgi:PLP dependent protein